MIKSFQTLDIYLASFLTFHGLTPKLETINSKVAFSFSADDTLYKLITKFNSDEPTPVNSFTTTVKMLRGRMLSMRGQR